MSSEQQTRLPFNVPAQNPYTNTLLYGPTGTGKTTAAASAPGPVLYVNGESENALYHARVAHPGLLEFPFRGVKSLIDVTNEIKEHADEWGTVVADPIADFYRILVEELSGRSMNPQLDHYKTTGIHIERWCRQMCELPVQFVIVAHDWPVKDESEGTVERLPYTGSASNPTLSQKLLAMVDIVAYTGVVDVASEEEEEPVLKYMGQLINANGRRGKDRFDVLDKVSELDLQEWQNRIKAKQAELVEPVAA